MATSGKKAKKHKGKTIPLTDFLADGTTGPGPGKVIVPRHRTWADEVENEDENGYYHYNASGRNKAQPTTLILPTAPRETRSVDEETVPRDPPFKAYIVNLHYDTSERDVIELFGDAKIVDVQLPRDDRGGGRLKGFGYVEFETREDLIAALVLDDTSIRGRRMRIEVSINNDAGGNNNSNERRGGRSYENREYDPERTQGDWRSGPRAELPPNKPAFKNNYAGNAGAVATKDRGAFTRGNMDGPLDADHGFTRRGDNAGSFSRYNAKASRSFSGENGDREGMLRSSRDHPPDGATTRFNNRSRYRDGNNASRGTHYGGNAYEERDRHFGSRGAGGGHYDEDRRQNHNGDQRNLPEMEEVSRTRPKLCLAQRTVATTEDLPPASAIFGGARPVDTAAREKEIDDNLMRQREESRGMRRAENEGDGTFTTNDDPDGKSLEMSEDLGVADEGVSLAREEEKAEGCGCGYETPEVEVVSSTNDDVEEVARSEETSREAPTGKERENQPVKERSSIFGGAKPVDTSTREREVEERLAKEKTVVLQAKPPARDRVELALVMQHLRTRTPVRSSTIFGGATPVDTAAREREVEERLAREREEKRARDEWRLAREKRGGKAAITDAPPSSVRQNNVHVGGAPATRPSPSEEVEPRAKQGPAESRRKTIHNSDEPQTKREDQRPQQQQVTKKYELAQPPVENVWLRRAAQHAANQERGQMLAPPMAFNNTHG